MRKDGNREERPVVSKFLWTAHFPFVHTGTGKDLSIVNTIPTFFTYNSANGHYFLSKTAHLINNRRIHFSYSLQLLMTLT